MKNFFLSFAAFLIMPSFAGTTVNCTGFEKGASVEYKWTSFHPCELCPMAPEQPPVVTVETRSSEGEKSLVRYRKWESKLSVIKESMTKSYFMLSTTPIDATGVKISEAKPSYLMEKSYSAILVAPIIPGGNMKVFCDEKVEAPRFNLLPK